MKNQEKNHIDEKKNCWGKKVNYYQFSTVFYSMFIITQQSGSHYPHIIKEGNWISVKKGWSHGLNPGPVLSRAHVLCSRRGVGTRWLMGQVRPAVCFCKWSFIRNTATPIRYTLAVAALSHSNGAEPLWQRPCGPQSWKPALWPFSGNVYNKALF